MSLNSKISIVLATDQNYFPGLWVTLVSLLMFTNSKKHFMFYVFDGGINDASKHKLVQVLKKLNDNFTINWLRADLGQFNSYKSMEGNFITYSRILIPKLLKERKSIWLDVDLLVLIDIEELWNTDMENKPIAACLEAPNITFGYDIKNPTEHNIQVDDSYFNAGVLVMNHDLLNGMDFTKKCLNYLEAEIGNYTFHDQSAINVVCHGKVKTLDRKWNQLNSLNREFALHLNLLKSQGFIYHFLERPKPWQKYMGDIFALTFYSIAAHSGLKLSKLNSIKNNVIKAKYKFPSLFIVFTKLSGLVSKKKRKFSNTNIKWLKNVKKYQKKKKIYNREILKTLNDINQLSRD